MRDADVKPVRLGDLTAAAFAREVAAVPVILLPLGSHEDHGPYQPMGDYILADVLAERIARRASAAGVPTFVAPCLPFGVADYFGSSPGGLALTPAHFRGVLSDLLEGLLRHGLNKIIIINGHGGNVPVIHEVTLELKRVQGLVVPSFYLWKIARQLMERRIGGGHGRFGHGAEPLLSLNLALRGACVQPEAGAGEVYPQVLGLPVSGFGTLDFEGLAVEAPVEFDMAPRPAIAAAWAAGSSELGEEIAEALVAAGTRFVAQVNASDV
jgi:creatinine amidohydrolase